MSWPVDFKDCSSWNRTASTWVSLEHSRLYVIFIYYFAVFFLCTVSMWNPHRYAAWDEKKKKIIAALLISPPPRPLKWTIKKSMALISQAELLKNHTAADREVMVPQGWWEGVLHVLHSPSRKQGEKLPPFSVKPYITGFLFRVLQWEQGSLLSHPG